VSRAVSHIRVLRFLAYLASVGIAIVCAIDLWAAVGPTLAWRLYDHGLIGRNLAIALLYDRQHGDPLLFVAQVLTGITFAIWLSRARSNVSVSAGASRLIASGWLLPMWIVPGINLVLPGLFVARVAEVSTAPPVERPSRSGLLALVWIWWGCWIGAQVSSLATSGLLSARIDTAPISGPLFVAVQALYVVAGVLAIVMMFKIVLAQRELFTARQPVPDAAQFPAFTVNDLPPPR
jgi:hypothetical protein